MEFGRHRDLTILQLFHERQLLRTVLGTQGDNHLASDIELSDKGVRNLK